MRRFVAKLALFLFILLLMYAPIQWYSWQLDYNEISMFAVLDKLENTEMGNSAEILIMGDSRALMMNMSPEFAAQNSIYNFCMPNSGGLHPYPYLLKRYLKSNPPPKAVILSFIPLMLTDNWDIFAPEVDFGSSELYRSSRLYALGDLFEEPIFRKHPATRKNLLKRYFSINKVYEKLAFTFDPDNYDRDTGYLIFEKDLEWSFSPDIYLLTIELEVSDGAIQFLEEFLQTARDHEIKVVFHNMPIPESVYQLRVEDDFYDNYFPAMHDLSAKYPNTLLVNEAIAHYPDNLFADESHLNEKGAMKFNQTDFRELISQVNEISDPQMAIAME